jgi:hypothetical protein
MQSKKLYKQLYRVYEKLLRINDLLEDQISKIDYLRLELLEELNELDRKNRDVDIRPGGTD